MWALDPREPWEHFQPTAQLVNQPCIRAEKSSADACFYLLFGFGATGAFVAVFDGTIAPLSDGGGGEVKTIPGGFRGMTLS